MIHNIVEYILFVAEVSATPSPPSFARSMHAAMKMEMLLGKSINLEGKVGQSFLLQNFLCFSEL